MKKFLINEYGKEQGEKTYKQQQERFYILVNNSNGKSKNQLKTLKNHILPIISLYQVLQETSGDKETSLQIAEKYSFEGVHAKVNLMRKIEKLPFFYEIFRRIFNKELKADNWELTVEQNNTEAMVFIIKKCLWHSTCVEHTCPEICNMFCKSDNMCYDSMKKITFRRTQTLGMGGECCDFKFINNKTK
ncbi:L-2-amino-thiazoline-4-carboxylic acid hydrolase [Clostridium lacusfryxellense]|uniref:L-2-amino-thiazoline-4-carboxylic acid hydrolase n=1 Tax=Clostridium lacusfryxellense TaxID=205328 RepID=UPI001C0D3259|nr:L-2-amino-thiazoline-4-carboxylic acid hydrolase [Clostridium lacusfryxellense]MBU3113674.1 L-2-amino-thiazoline-4-carboxylic acid hydrolase [Clostridium lacusfryxellense]